MSIDFPDAFLNMLPTPALVIKEFPDGPNRPIVFVNNQFITEIGWTVDDIPDKQSWWQTAFPNPDYQKVVARQWDLCVDLANEQHAGSVEMEVNITTKHRGIIRFKASTELHEQVIPGHFVVIYQTLEKITGDI